MCTLRRVDLFLRRIFQAEDDVDAPKYEHAVLDFDFTICHRGQVTFAGDDPARLQRATQGAEQSPAGRGNDVIDRGRMRIGNVTLDAVVTRDWTVCAEAYRFLLRRHVREAQRPLDPSQRNFCFVDDVAHECITVCDRSQGCS